MMSTRSNSPLVEAETKEAAPSRNTTRGSIVVPQSAAYENQNQNQVGEEEPATGHCGAVGPKGESQITTGLLLVLFYRRGGQTPNSTL